MDNSLDRMERLLYKRQTADVAGRLAGGIAHDFSNRLNGIIGSANVIRMRTDDDDVRAAATDIVGICRAAGTLIKDTLTLVRHRPQNVTAVSVNDIVSTVTGLLECALDKRIIIKKVLDASPQSVMADAVELQSVMLDLALNAKESLPESGGVITFSTTHEQSESNGFVKIAISDTGSGLSSVAQAHLFEPFFTTKVGHAGLGLAASLRLVKSMGGTIDLTNNKEQGATATIAGLRPAHIVGGR